MNVQGALTIVLSNAQTQLGHSDVHAMLGTGWPAMGDLAMVSLYSQLMLAQHNEKNEVTLH